MEDLQNQLWNAKYLILASSLLGGFWEYYKIHHGIKTDLNKKTKRQKENKFFSILFSSIFSGGSFIVFYFILSSQEFKNSIMDFSQCIAVLISLIAGVVGGHLIPKVLFLIEEEINIREAEKKKDNKKRIDKLKEDE